MSHDGEMTAIPYEQWEDHPWLSRLDSGSDTELDPAWFFTVKTAPAPLAALDQIIVQERGNDGPWEASIRADGTFFPSRGWGQAAVGWYQHIWGFLDDDVKWQYRALLPARWDCASVPKQTAKPRCDYFSDWRTRIWTCNCGWEGTNETALVFHDDDVVSVACPECAHGLALVNRQPNEKQVAAAAAAGNSEALTMLDPGAHANPEVEVPTARRFVTGHETEVLFTRGEQFFGVPAEWLVPRLRLDPRVREMDLLYSGGLLIAVDNELVEDLDLDSVLGGSSTTLCTYGDGGIVGGGTDLSGQWLVDWAPEVRHRLSLASADDLSDLRQLALSKISEGMDGWWPQEGDRFEVTSPHLDDGKPEDVEAVLWMAGEASEVALNGHVVHPRPS